MSQMALIEINCRIENIQKINKFSLDGMTFLTTDQKYQLDFMNITKTYIHILNDYDTSGYPCDHCNHYTKDHRWNDLFLFNFHIHFSLYIL